MEHYTSQIIVNGESRTILIYKSEEPMTFDTPGYHKFILDEDTGLRQIIYSTNPEPYRTITPEESDSGPYYFYWFLVNRIDTTELIINDTATQDAATYAELAAAIREGVNEVE